VHKGPPSPGTTQRLTYPSMRRSSICQQCERGHLAAVTWHKRSFFRPVNACRCQIYYEYLPGAQINIDHVMITEIRDVIFQSHPFAGMTNNKMPLFPGAKAKIGQRYDSTL
jgi:hypothetical protein